MKIVRYTIDHKDMWNSFVKNAKNTHFFFNRDYMEYHSDRFEDFSLLVFDNKDKLVALFPANIKNDIVYSHQGLTFGGLLLNDGIHTETVLEIFEKLIYFLKTQKVKKLIYKCIPYIYHKKPAEEDRYALFLHNAKLIRRDASSVIYLQKDIKYKDSRKYSIKKAKKSNLIFEESKNFEYFWQILTDVLRKQHNTLPTHNIEEIKKLAYLFPENIKLFVSRNDKNILAGIVIFENEETVHTQYIAASEEGKKIGALDFLIDRLINDIYKNKKFFSFGISTEQEGRYLNRGLIFQKEGFGASTIVHDIYEIEIK